MLDVNYDKPHRCTKCYASAIGDVPTLWRPFKLHRCPFCKHYRRWHFKSYFALVKWRYYQWPKLHLAGGIEIWVYQHLGYIRRKYRSNK